MKQRIDYWHDGQRHPLKLSAYALGLLSQCSDPPSQAITVALTAWLGQADPLTAAQSFIATHAGMNLSLLVEIAISRHYDRT